MTYHEYLLQRININDLRANKAGLRANNYNQK